MQHRAWGYQVASNTIGLSLVDQPKVGENQVLVANKAIGINPVDWKFIATNPRNWLQGHIPGVDGAGVIVAVGGNVDSALIGRRVAYHAALKNDGSFAEFTLLNAERVMTMPDNMTFEQAAALPCPLLTAWQAFEKIPLTANRHVLIVGFGAVNSLLSQILVAAGYQVDVLSASLGVEQASALGIRHVYRQQSQISSGYFAIFDAVNGENATDLLPLLKANGHIICILGRIPAPVDPAFTRTISYHEIALGALHEFGDQDDWQNLMQHGEALFARIMAGEIQVTSPCTFGFEQLPAGLEHSNRSKQKTVVTLT